MKNPAFATSNLPSLPEAPKPADFQFERQEWTLFRSVNTLSQKAGVPAAQLRRLVLKELADNALDAGSEHVRIDALDASGDRYFVEDDGPGVEPDSVTRLFSINRPLITSKLRRLPTRGAMGNGLRVVTGAVAASDGALRVQTRGKLFTLKLENDGSTTAEVSDAEARPGTRVEIEFGPAVPPDRAALAWARTAAQLSWGGSAYAGRPSPFWYDADAFYELLQAAGERPVRDLIASLDGCTGAKAGRIAAAFKNASCATVARTDAVALLAAARREARAVRPERLGAIGERSDIGAAYAIRRGTFVYGGRDPKAVIPFVVEAWASDASDYSKSDFLDVAVNRSPITGSVAVYRNRGSMVLHGCGTGVSFPLSRGGLDLQVNVTTPFCPITTDGKEPDLGVFVDAIAAVIQRVGRKARQASPRAGRSQTAKAVVLENLGDAVDKASGGGLYRFNQRQLFYVIRPFVFEELGVELTYGNFDGIITDYEAAEGDVPGMYRDPRGTLYHPHLGRDIPLGTLAVEEYSRPEWLFNKVLYIEKEGPFEALKAVRWPERHDCALLTSKGFTTRAAKDFLDLLADDGEPVTVFCVHDADASGTTIYETLQEETRARGRRLVEIVNLGLEPWEAVEMGLQVERIKERERTAPVAKYVTNRPDGAYWSKWLEEQRVELNAMTTPEFIAWLDGKMAEHSGEKVVPPPAVAVAEFRKQAAGHKRRLLIERILREAGLERQLDEAMLALAVPEGEDLIARIREWLEQHDADLWSSRVEALALEAAAGGEASE